MDTKSKNFNLARAFKIAAALLSVICIGISGFFTAVGFQNFALYGQEDYLLGKPTSLTESHLFYDLIDGDLSAVYRAYDPAGYLAREEADLKERLPKDIQSAKAIRNGLQRELESYANDHGYSESPDETSIYRDPNEFYSTVTIQDSNFSDTLYIHYSYGTRRIHIRWNSTDEELTNELTAIYAEILADTKMRYKENRAESLENIAFAKNLHITVVDEEQSKILYSNVDGVTYEETPTYYKSFQKHLFCPAKGNASGTMAKASYVISDINNLFTRHGHSVYLAIEDGPFTQSDRYSMLLTAHEDAPQNSFLELLSKSAIFAALGILFLVLSLFFGGKANKEKQKLLRIDKIPTDLHFLLTAGVLGGLGVLFAFLFEILYYGGSFGYTGWQYYNTYSPLIFKGFCLIPMLMWLVFYEWVSHTARFARAGKSWLQSSLIYLVLRQLILKPIALLKAAAHDTKHFGAKVFAGVAGYILFNFAGAFGLWFASEISIWLLLPAAGILLFVNIGILALVWRYILALDKIMQASEGCKTGNPQTLNTASMPGAMQTLAQNLSYTQEELRKAVNEAVKGERLKTELITNVSHDLKTPLTSIISYVSLLQKCDIDDVEAQKYIDVLDEKSARLKRLIEDLVEASKASSGSVQLHPVLLDLNKLAVQSVGEISDALEANNLEVILDTPETPTLILADSQKTWRVADNLLSNVRKYGAPGTRVYIQVGKNGEFGEITVKNISKAALNINPDELTGRFVRGDSARTQEGSGLGLSIAKDLCALQGGELKIAIDGDLFKATVRLPLAPQTAQLASETAPTETPEA